MANNLLHSEFYKNFANIQRMTAAVAANGGVGSDMSANPMAAFGFFPQMANSIQLQSPVQMSNSATATNSTGAEITEVPTTSQPSTNQ